MPPWKWLFVRVSMIIINNEAMENALEKLFKGLMAAETNLVLQCVALNRIQWNFFGGWEIEVDYYFIDSQQKVLRTSSDWMISVNYLERCNIRNP